MKVFRRVRPYGLLVNNEKFNAKEHTDDDSDTSQDNRVPEWP